MTALLEVEGLEVHYGPVHAVKGVDLAVHEGTVTALLGANGAGKTTTLMAVAGLRKISAGDIRFDGRSLVGTSSESIVRQGVGVSPEGRRVFTALTVAENLRLAGAIHGDAAKSSAIAENLMERFPILGTRRHQRAGLLSGGEQQMLALARALMGKPRLLLLDEPSLGLAPQMVDRVFDLIAELREEGIAVLLVEQNVPLSLEIAQEAVILANGRMAARGDSEKVAQSDVIHAAYLT